MKSRINTFFHFEMSQKWDINLGDPNSPISAELKKKRSRRIKQEYKAYNRLLYKVTHLMEILQYFSAGPSCTFIFYRNSTTGSNYTTKWNERKKENALLESRNLLYIDFVWCIVIQYSLDSCSVRMTSKIFFVWRPHFIRFTYAVALLHSLLINLYVE